MTEIFLIAAMAIPRAPVAYAGRIIEIDVAARVLVIDGDRSLAVPGVHAIRIPRGAVSGSYRLEPAEIDRRFRGEWRENHWGAHAYGAFVPGPSRHKGRPILEPVGGPTDVGIDLVQE